MRVLLAKFLANTFSRLPTLCRALLKASLFSFVFLDSMGLGLGVFRSSCALATLYAVLTEKLVPSRPWDVAALAAAGTDCCSKTCSAKRLLLRSAEELFAA